MNKIHWVVDGAPKCGGPGDGVTIQHLFDPNQLKLTCGQCCSSLSLWVDEVGIATRIIVDRSPIAEVSA